LNCSSLPFFGQNESASEERLLELRAKVIELDCVLVETKEKLGHVQQQNSDLESHLADTKEKLKQQQTLVSGLEEERTRLKSELDEVSLVSGCKSVNKYEQVCTERECFNTFISCVYCFT
jgi:chromosome segregation ATPase